MPESSKYSIPLTQEIADTQNALNQHYIDNENKNQLNEFESLPDNIKKYAYNLEVATGERRRKEAPGVIEPLVSFGLEGLQTLVKGGENIGKTLKEAGLSDGNVEEYFRNVNENNPQWNAPDDPSWYSKLGGVVGSALGSTLPAMTAGVAGSLIAPGVGTAAGFAVTFAQTFGDNVDRNRKAGYDEDKALGMAFLESGVDTIIENLPFGIIGKGTKNTYRAARAAIKGKGALLKSLGKQTSLASKVGKKLVQKVGKDTADNILLKWGKSAAMDGLGEAGEEGFQYLNSYLNQKLGGDPNAEFSLDELADSIAQGFIGGFFLQAARSTPSLAVESYRKRQRANAGADTAPAAPSAPVSTNPLSSVPSGQSAVPPSAPVTPAGAVVSDAEAQIIADIDNMSDEAVRAAVGRMNMQGVDAADTPVEFLRKNLIDFEIARHRSEVEKNAAVSATAAGTVSTPVTAENSIARETLTPEAAPIVAPEVAGTANIPASSAAPVAPVTTPTAAAPSAPVSTNPLSSVPSIQSAVAPVAETPANDIPEYTMPDAVQSAEVEYTPRSGEAISEPENILSYSEADENLNDDFDIDSYSEIPSEVSATAPEAQISKNQKAINKFTQKVKEQFGRQVQIDQFDTKTIQDEDLKNTLIAAQRIFKALGMGKVVMVNVDDHGVFKGATIPGNEETGNRAIIDTELVKGSPADLFHTAMHELVHNLIGNNEEAYLKFKKAVIDKIYNKDYYNELFENYLINRGFDLVDFTEKQQATIEEEFICDTVADLMQTEKFWEILTAEDMSFAQKLLNALKDLLAKITSGNQNNIPKTQQIFQKNLNDVISLAQQFVIESSKKDISSLIRAKNKTAPTTATAEVSATPSTSVPSVSSVPSDKSEVSDLAKRMHSAIESGKKLHQFSQKQLDDVFDFLIDNADNDTILGEIDADKLMSAITVESESRDETSATSEIRKPETAVPEKGTAKENLEVAKDTSVPITDVISSKSKPQGEVVFEGYYEAADEEQKRLSASDPENEYYTVSTGDRTGSGNTFVYKRPWSDKWEIFAGKNSKESAIKAAEILNKNAEKKGLAEEFSYSFDKNKNVYWVVRRHKGIAQTTTKPSTPVAEKPEPTTSDKIRKKPEKSEMSDQSNVSKQDAEVYAKITDQSKSDTLRSFEFKNLSDGRHNIAGVEFKKSYYLYRLFKNSDDNRGRDASTDDILKAIDKKLNSKQTGKEETVSKKENVKEPAIAQKTFSDKFRAKEKEITGVNNPNIIIASGTDTGWGSNNKLVSKDAYEAAKERMRKRMNRMNMGFDPELLSDGALMTAFHIEAGARKFADYAKKMIADLGDNIKPYLKFLYNGAREFPGMEEKIIAEMDSAETVKGIDVDNLDKTAATDKATLKEDLRQLLLSDRKTLSKSFDIKNIARKYGLDDKTVQEMIETEIVSMIGEINSENISDEAKFKKLVDLYNRQPKLSTRTSTSIRNQAYSTPAPLAWILQKRIGIENADRVYEPTAGTGMLVSIADKSKTVVNELNDLRVDTLRDQNFKTVTQNDAVSYAPSGEFSHIIMNPPFGNSEAKKIDGFTLSKLDHQIAAKALSTLSDNGKAAIIIGANNENRTSGKPTASDWTFLNYLYNKFNVVDNFVVDGALYDKQGASYPVRVITIDGRKNSENIEKLAPTDIEKINSWDKVYDKLKGTIYVDEKSGAVQRSGRNQRDDVGSSREYGTTPENSSGVSEVSGTDVSDQNRSGERGRGRSGNLIDGQTSDQVRQPVQSVRRELQGSVQSDGSNKSVSGRRGDSGELFSDSEVLSGNRESAGQTGDTGRGRSGRNIIRGVDNGDVSASGTVDVVKKGKQVSDLHTEYAPASKATPLQTVTPTYMADGLVAALNRLQDKYGNIDEFVRRELGYSSLEELFSGLAAEQIDGVALAIDSLKNKTGFIIGDQTGVGKGRQAAAIQRWAIRNGKIPIFFTKYAQLFSDMYADGKDINTTFNPLVIGSSVEADINDKETGKLLIKHTAASKAGNKLQQLIDQDGTLDGLWTTYIQISQAGDTARKLIEKLVDTGKAVVIMDEAHEAAGDSKTGLFFRGGTTKAKTNSKGERKEGEHFDGILNKSDVIYLSATFAKRADNMPLYFRTSISKAVDDLSKLPEIMTKGGEPLQQWISQGLAEDGQMKRSERDFTGVVFDPVVYSPDNISEIRKEYDKVAEALRDMIAYSNLVKKNINDKLSYGKANTQEDQATKNNSFASSSHNFISSLLLALKLDATADRVAKAAAKGEKPVIALIETKGAFLDDYISDNDLKSGDRADIKFTDVLISAVNRMYKYHAKDAAGDLERGSFTPEELGLTDMHNAIISKIENLGIDLPASPIDYLRNELSLKGVTTGEVTGRTTTLDYSGAYPVIVRRTAADKDKKAQVRSFNNGDIDAIILNAAGSTGISLHADQRFKDQKPRKMFMIQPSLNVSDVMQMFGRVLRSGQVVKPSYEIFSLALPAEKRPTMVLAKKMRSLNANTSANAKGNIDFGVDVLNKYGDIIASEYLASHGDIAKETNISIEYDEDGNPKKPEDGLMRKFLGKAAILPSDVQDKIYKEISENYNEYVEQLKAIGEYDLELESHDDWDVKTLESDTVTSGNEQSIFTSPVIRKTVSINVKKNIPSQDFVNKELKDAFGGKSSDEVIADLEKQIQPIREAIEKMDNTVWEGKDDKFIAERKNMNNNRIEKFLEFVRYAFGSTLSITIGDDVYFGVISQIKISDDIEPKNPAMNAFKVRFTVGDNVAHLTYNYRQISAGKPFVTRTYMRFSEIFTGEKQEIREERQIFAGNLLKAYELIGDKGSGKVVTYMTSDGKRETGILMSKKWKPGEMARDPRNELDSVEEALEELKSNDSIMTADGNLSISKLSYRDAYYVYANKKKSEGGKYYLDENITDITGDFYSRSGRMRSNYHIDEDAVKKLLEYLYGKTKFRKIRSGIKLSAPGDRADNSTWNAMRKVAEERGWLEDFDSLDRSSDMSGIIADMEWMWGKKDTAQFLKDAGISAPGDRASGELKLSIPNVWTGSAADYDKPSLHYIGSGEGSQVYGWGLYGSSSRDVAEWYAKNDAINKSTGVLLVDGKSFRSATRDNLPAQRALERLFYGYSDSIESLEKYYKDQIQSMEKLISENISIDPYQLRMSKESLQWIKDNKDKITFTPPRKIEGNRNLYKQTFFAGKEENLLNWDKPVNKKQKNLIIKQAEKEGLNVSNILWDGGKIYGNALYNYLATPSYLGSPKAASEFLYRAGIDGITYIGDSSGVRNYVAFSDEDIKVDEHIKFSMPGDRGDTSLDPVDYRRSIDPMFDFFMEYSDNGILNPGSAHIGEDFSGAFISPEFVAYSVKRKQGKNESDATYRKYLERRQSALENASGASLDTMAKDYVEKFGGDEAEVAEKFLDMLRHLSKKDLISERAEAKREEKEAADKQRKEDEAEWQKQKAETLRKKVDELFKAAKPVVDKRWIQINRQIYTALFKTVFPDAQTIPDIPSDREMRILNMVLENGNMSEAALIAEPYYTDKDKVLKDKLDKAQAETLTEFILRSRGGKGFMGLFNDINGKPDINLLEYAIMTPMWIAKKFAGTVVESIYKAARMMVDDKNRIMRYLSGDAFEKLMQLRQKDKAMYDKLNAYILKCDRDQTGAGTVKGNKEQTEFTATTADGEVIGKFDNEETAWDALFKREQESLVDNGYSELAAESLYEIRSAMRRSFLFRLHSTIQYLRQAGLIDAKSTSFIIRDPEQFFPGEDIPANQEIDLFELMREMGQRSGYYMPRIRHGKYMLRATKAGHPVILKGFDSKAARVLAIGDYHLKGYKTENFLANTPDQDMLGQLNPAALSDILNQAMERAKDAFSKDIQIDEVSYVTKDGKSIPQLAVTSKMKLSYAVTYTLKKLGGRYYDGAWRFDNFTPETKTKLKEIIESEVTNEVKTAMVMQSVIGSSIVDMIRENSSGSSKITRRTAVGDEVVQGYEEDVLRAYGLYISGVSGASARNVMAKKMYAAFGGMDFDREEYINSLIPENLEKGTPEYQEALTNATSEYFKEVHRRALNSAKSPRIAKYMDKYIKDMLRNSTSLDRVLGAAKGISAVWMLNKPASAINNLFGAIGLVPAVIDSETKCGIGFALGNMLSGLNKYIKYARYNKWGMGKPLTGVDSRIFDIIHKNSWDGAEMVADATKAGLTFAGRKYQSFSNFMLGMFSMVESGNRASSIYAAAMALAKKRGVNLSAMNDVQLQDFLLDAVKISDFGNGVYDKTNKLTWARGGDWQSVIDSALLFKTYEVNYYNNMWNMLNHKNLKGLLYTTVSIIAMGGGKASIPVTLLLGALAALGITDPDDEEESDEYVYNLIADVAGQKTANVAKYGIPSLLGINLSGTYRDTITDVLHDGVPDATISISDLPAYSIFKRYKNMKEYGFTQPGKMVEEILPALPASMSRSIREYNTGVTDRAGRQRKDVNNEYIKPDKADTILRFLGFNPVSISEKTDRIWTEKKVKEKYAEQRREIYSRYRDYMKSGDTSDSKLAQLALDIEEYNAKVARSNRNIPLIDEAGLNRAAKDTESKFLKSSLDEKAQQRREKKEKGKIVIRNGKLVREEE